MLAQDWSVRAVSYSPALPALGLVFLGARDAASQPQPLWYLQREGVGRGQHLYLLSGESPWNSFSSNPPYIIPYLIM